jgi:flagellar basal-body rod protein FlgB
MIDALFSQPNYIAAKKMLDVTALRHEAIASNLANIETPHYRRIDVDPSFMKQLQQAVAAQDGERLNSLEPALAPDMTAVSSRRDGNTVELDTELINLNQNSMAHSLETQLITSSLVKLRSAVTGRSA